MDWMELINQSITIARKGKNRGSVVSKTKKKRTVIVAESTKDTVRMSFKRKKAAPDNAMLCCLLTHLLDILSRLASLARFAGRAAGTEVEKVCPDT